MILGGHGQVALLAIPKLDAAGHRVSAAFRNPDHVDDVVAAGATPIVADLAELDPERFTLLFSGVDTVVWSAGAGGDDLARINAVDRDAAVHAIDAARSAGVRHFIRVSYLGAGPARALPEDPNFDALVEAKVTADAHLRESGMDWTIIVPGNLTDQPGNGHLGFVNLGGPVQGSLDTARELVAEVIAAIVSAPAEQVEGREIQFRDGDVPIAEALAARV